MAAEKQVPERKLPQIVYARSAEMRRQFMDEYFRPIAERLLEREEQIDAVMVAFAQYWSDEADDAVHDELILLVDRSLTLEEAYTERNLPFFDPYVWDEDEEQPLNQRPGAVDMRGLVHDVQQELFGRAGYWDNYHFVAAFAAYTKEDCHQEMSTPEAYLPYALFVRSGEGVACHTVGQLLRPHLEDQPPSFHRDE